MTEGKNKIFISYRRNDSSGYAGRIYDRLSAHFGKPAVFMDVDTIDAGDDFVKVLEDAVQGCDVLLALIGPQWLSIEDQQGQRRLNNAEDFVRIEIATALKRDIRVIPVLLDGARMPQSTDLPDNLKLLARRNALQVNHQSFDPDTQRLMDSLERVLGVPPEAEMNELPQKMKQDRQASTEQPLPERRSKLGEDLIGAAIVGVIVIIIIIFMMNA